MLKDVTSYQSMCCVIRTRHDVIDLRGHVTWCTCGTGPITLLVRTALTGLEPRITHSYEKELTKMDLYARNYMEQTCRNNIDCPWFVWNALMGLCVYATVLSHHCFCRLCVIGQSIMWKLYERHDIQIKRCMNVDDISVIIVRMCVSNASLIFTA